MVEGAALEMLCSQKEPRVRIPNSPPKKSSKLKGLLDFPFLSDSLNFPIFALERR